MGLFVAVMPPYYSGADVGWAGEVIGGDAMHLLVSRFSDARILAVNVTEAQVFRCCSKSCAIQYAKGETNE